MNLSETLGPNETVNPPDAMNPPEIPRPRQTTGKRVSYFRLAVVICAAVVANLGATASAAAQSRADLALKARVEAALASASDVPADSITVEVSDGVVTLSGSVVGEECGGRRTPGGFGTVQQSLGAVVRAIPGVVRLEFELRYQPAAGGAGGAGA